jgi:hypothetical protein
MDIQILCNTPDEELFANVRANSAACQKWVKSSWAHDKHAVIVGGGPSIHEYLPSILKRYEHGQTIFALNGAARFLNLNGLIPDYQVILDARPDNVDLVATADDYLFASQCDPALFEAVDNVTLWHPCVEGLDEELPDYDDEYALIGGGTTVGLSAMCLAYAMGYRTLHLYGYDSSHRNTMGHAYSQNLNNKDILCKVTMGGRVFTSSLTMARQAELFPEVCNNLIDLGCLITVDGDGLIMAVMDEMRLNQVPDIGPSKTNEFSISYANV